MNNKNSVTSNKEIEFAGIKFRSPVGVASVGIPCGKEVSVEQHVEVLLKHAEAGASFIVTPGISYSTEKTIDRLRSRAVPEERSVYPKSQLRFLKIDKENSRLGVAGVYTLATPFMMTPEYVRMRDSENQNLIKQLVKNKPREVRLIGNINGFGDFPETWAEAAKMMEQLGVDLIEVNVSCPGPLGTRKAIEYYLSKKYPMRLMGILVGDYSEISASVVAEVVKAVKIPVGCKLTGETGFPRIVDMVKKIKDAGAAWVSTLNVSAAIVPPDIYNHGKPLWPFSQDNPFVGVSGPCLIQDCYKYVAAIGKFVPGIDIMGVGGISTPKQCVEAMMLGSKLVGVCTGILYQGRNLVRRANTFIDKYMREQGYNKLEDFVGLGLQYITHNEEVTPITGKVVARLDPDKCTGCGICLDNYCINFRFENGRVRNDEDNCSGCGACLVMCPANAIELVQRK